MRVLRRERASSMDFSGTGFGEEELEVRKVLEGPDRGWARRRVWFVRKVCFWVRSGGGGFAIVVVVLNLEWVRICL